MSRNPIGYNNNLYVHIYSYPSQKTSFTKLQCLVEALCSRHTGQAVPPSESVEALFSSHTGQTVPHSESVEALFSSHTGQALPPS